MSRNNIFIIQLNGGLGNQMFQYAFGKTLSIEKKAEVLYDNSLLNYNSLSGIGTLRDFELDNFQLQNDTFIGNNIWWLKPFKKTKYLHYAYLKILLLKYNLKVLKQNISEHPKLWFNIKNQSYIIGSFQSEYWIKKNESIIRESFQLKLPIPDNCELTLKEIIQTESVAIHIRRGDYVLERNQKIHGLCDLTYYKNAIQNINANVRNPTFFIFSDDIDWVKNNLKIKTKNTVHYVDEIESANVFKLHLMSICKHQIIANSSFSWWAAWLNSNEQKIVIAPKSWFGSSELSFLNSTIVPSSWYKI